MQNFLTSILIYYTNIILQFYASFKNVDVTTKQGNSPKHLYFKIV